jgi:sRNA-binding carbon storage regulator CsrA
MSYILRQRWYRLAYVAASLETAGQKIWIADAVAQTPNQTSRAYKGFLKGLEIEEMTKLIDEDTTLIGISAPAVLIIGLKKELAQRMEHKNENHTKVTAEAKSNG